MCGLLGGAAAVAALCGASASASTTEEPADQSAEVRSIILGPLYQELNGRMEALDAPRQAGADFATSPQAASLHYAPAPTPTSHTASARPSAARFADAALIARSDPTARDRLAAFTGEEATLVSSAAGGRVSLAMFDGEAPSAAFLGFQAEYAESLGRALRNERNRPRRMAVRYEGSFDTTGSDGLDYGLAPRAGVSFGGRGAAVETGATVRLGRYIDMDFDRPAWWFFAGADRQAVMYDPGQGFDVRGALAMEPYAIVGDAQAGVAMRMGATDVSFAYVHRETEYSMPQQSWDTQEGFAAFSLTWRR